MSDSTYLGLDCRMTCSAVYTEPELDTKEEQLLADIFGGKQRRSLTCERPDAHCGSHQSRYGDGSIVIWDEELAVTVVGSDAMIIEPANISCAYR